MLTTFARSRTLTPPQHLGQAVELLARLGVWLARTRDPPGAHLLWHGYTRRRRKPRGSPTHREWRRIRTWTAHRACAPPPRAAQPSRGTVPRWNSEFSLGVLTDDRHQAGMAPGDAPKLLSRIPVPANDVLHQFGSHQADLHRQFGTVSGRQAQRRLRDVLLDRTRCCCSMVPDTGASAGSPRCTLIVHAFVTALPPFPACRARGGWPTMPSVRTTL